MSFFAVGKFDIPICAKETSARKRQKWLLALDISKSKNMRRYFEASSVIKCDKDKGNKNVIGFD